MSVVHGRGREGVNQAVNQSTEDAVHVHAHKQDINDDTVTTGQSQAVATHMRGIIHTLACDSTALCHTRDQTSVIALSCLRSAVFFGISRFAPRKLR